MLNPSRLLYWVHLVTNFTTLIATVQVDTIQASKRAKSSKLYPATASLIQVSMDKPDNWVPVQDGPSFHPRKLKVVCIGAGYAGLMLSYQYKHIDAPLDHLIDLNVYEKSDDIGGTW